jgi:three-Cys-motif partner protein
MSEDTLPTVWAAEPHTLAKLAILKAYLQAWMPILARQVASRGRDCEVVYVDAFSGPGEYRGGEPGSPLVAIKTAMEHVSDFPTRIRMFFIEERQDRWQHLSQLLKPHLKAARRNSIVEPPIHGSADTEIRCLLQKKEFRQYCPMLVFLDQFGYSQVPMDLIEKIMSGTSREVFAFMNWRDLNHYLTDDSKWPGIDRTFGGSEWREILNIKSSMRSQRFLQLYDEALRVRGRVVFSYSFSMHDQNDQLLYWLVFCSNNDRGLEEMKKAMWAIDSTGYFRFSDKHSGQLSLLPGFNNDWLAGTLRSALAGRQMNVREIRHHILTETPCYTYNEALAQLERNGEIEIVSCPPGRRKGSFAKYVDDDSLVIRFLNRSRSEQMPLFG